MLTIYASFHFYTPEMQSNSTENKYVIEYAGLKHALSDALWQDIVNPLSDEAAESVDCVPYQCDILLGNAHLVGKSD